MMTIRIGTRGSDLALAQARIVREGLLSLHPGIKTELKIIRTQGDMSSEPLSVIGGKGVFVKEIEHALALNEIDLAVHSLKDMQSICPQNLEIAAFLKREDPSDMIFSKFGYSLKTLPVSSNVGTSSARRVCQLKNIRPDIHCIDIRGNIATRLKKIGSGYDAIILAAAGVKRLGLDPGTAIDKTDMIPSPGQAIIAVQTRSSDAWLKDLLKPLDDPDTRICALTERGFLAELGSDCMIPAAAYAVVTNGVIHLESMLGTTDGAYLFRKNITGKSSEIGAAAASELMGRLKGVSQ